MDLKFLEHVRTNTLRLQKLAVTLSTYTQNEEAIWSYAIYVL